MSRRPMHALVGILVPVLLLAAPVNAPTAPHLTGTYVVNTTDAALEPGTDPCNAAHCSLTEAAIMTNMHAGPDRITFNLPGDPPYVIFLGTPEGRTFLEPNLWGDETEVDATTQPGWPVYLHGLGEAPWGLVIHSDRNTVRGLGFLGFNENALVVEGNNNFIDRVVVGDYLGGGLILAPIANSTGILLNGNGNTVRGASVANNTTGIWTYGTGNSIEFNHIGSIFDSSSRNGNENGIRLNGDDTSVRYNTIVGNSQDGVFVLSNRNIIMRNWIGKDNSTGLIFGNRAGISLYNGSGNQVGGAEAYDGNVVVDNQVGILVFTLGNHILNNRVGVDFGGAAIPNGTGIKVGLEEGNLIGGDWLESGNIIAHNTGDGIQVNSANDVRIYRNTIFENGGHGISVVDEYGAAPAEGMQVDIRSNGIYENGGLGIAIGSAGLNHGVEHPIIRRVSGTTVSGTACPGCVVELFEAAPDPSGHGEGQTFLVRVLAADDGSFSAEIPPLEACDKITATATDELYNTSDFSSDANAGMCIRVPTYLTWLWVILIGGGTAGAMIWIGRRRPLLAWGIVGGLLGIGLAVGGLYLPFVQVTRPATPAPSQESPGNVPACSQILASAKLQPAEGAIFQAGEDPIFELSPQPDPPGILTRWQVTVLGPQGDSSSAQVTRGVSFPLSSLGLDPGIPGDYYWTVSAERQGSAAEEWLPWCAEVTKRSFRISPPGQVPMTEQPTPAPEAVVRQDAACRSGPGMDYPILNYLATGVQFPVQGKNEASTWWFLGDCWVFGDLLDLSGDTGQVPVIQVEPPPITPTVPPVDCSQYSTNPNACSANQVCFWDLSNLQIPNGFCNHR